MTQRLPNELTPLDVAFRRLLENISAVNPLEVPIADSIGGISVLSQPSREIDSLKSIAVVDGWATCAGDTVGASAYAPLPQALPPIWVEAGDRLPDRCDCILDASMVEQSADKFYIIAEVNPGHGIRKVGGDNASGGSLIEAGRQISAFDRLAASAAGFERILIRRPRVAVVDIPSNDGNTASSQFIEDFAKDLGAHVIALRTAGRDVSHIEAAMDSEVYDLLVTVGGTGVGRTDATIDALAKCGDVLAHGLALSPGRTAAVGKIKGVPVIAVPGAADQTLAVCLTLIQPTLDLLSARSAQREIARPLARKIASAIGVTEIVLMKKSNDAWMPLATGELSPAAIARADAWLAVPGDSEGYAAGAMVNAYCLRGGM